MSAVPPTSNDSSAAGPSKTPLTRRWLLNLVLLGVVLTLALFAWYRPGDDNKPALRLTDISPQAVRRVEIEQKNQPSVLLERSDAGWRVVAPVKARANGFAVDTLLRLLQAPTQNPLATSDADLGRYGLDKPSLTVRVDDAAIHFGDIHPIRDEHYVHYGSSVYLISSRFYAQAAARYSNYIDTLLIETGRKPVAFKLPKFTLEIKDGTWQRRPEEQALSSDRINAFVDDWQHARALNVEQHSGRLVQERVTITFESEGGTRTPLTLGVIARSPELVLVRPDEQLDYHFPEETAQRLLTLSADNPK